MIATRGDYATVEETVFLDASGAEITDTEHIGHRNPFRYRGYYYPAETGHALLRKAVPV